MKSIDDLIFSSGHVESALDLITARSANGPTTMFGINLVGGRLAGSANQSSLAEEMIAGASTIAAALCRRRTDLDYDETVKNIIFQVLKDVAV